MAVENVAMVMHAEAGRITARKSRLSRQIADGHAPSAQNARIMIDSTTVEGHHMCFQEFQLIVEALSHSDTFTMMDAIWNTGMWVAGGCMAASCTSVIR